MATTEHEVVKARDQFRLRMARAERTAYDLMDTSPEKIAEMAAIPPHLVGR